MLTGTRPRRNDQIRFPGWLLGRFTPTHIVVYWVVERLFQGDEDWQSQDAGDECQRENRAVNRPTSRRW